MLVPNPDNLSEAKTLTSENGGLTQIGIAIVQRTNQFLVGVRGTDAALGGLSEFPGGKCEDNEAPAVCAVRECLEETGLRVRVVELIAVKRHGYAHGDLELHFFRCSLCEDQQTAPDGTFRWIDRDQLGQLPFPAANTEVIRQLSAKPI